jgi:hypothetical protein
MNDYLKDLLIYQQHYPLSFILVPFLLCNDLYTSILIFISTQFHLYIIFNYLNLNSYFFANFHSIYNHLLFILFIPIICFITMENHY